MRLTPADVHNVAFKKPSIGKRGYDEDEVDAFLDLVEAELSRLIEENNELTQRAAVGAGSDHLVLGTGAQATGSTPSVEPDSASPQSAQEPAPQPASAPAAAPQATPADAGPGATSVQAARLLGLAQETAERLTGDAAAEAEATRSAANAESERQVADARAEAARLLADAQGRSESLVGEATAKAEALERDSQARAQARKEQAEQAYATAMGQLTEQRAALERKISDLRTYEREYRSRLKSWISEQLSQLDESGAVADGGAQPAAVGGQ